MTLDLTRLLFDFGLTVLIWMVQLVVYPGFRYYEKAALLEWHTKYTWAISYIVMPLMTGQLAISLFQLFAKVSWYTLTSAALILLAWLSTFLQFVPRHRKISKGLADKKLLTELVRLNWIRTWIWSILFLLSLIRWMG